MAIITRFANPNSPAGGDGTTNATAGANRAYSSQNEMEAAEETDLDLAGDSFHGVCAGGVDSTIVVYSGWTTGVNNTITISASDFPSDAVLDVSKYNMDMGTSSGKMLTISEEFFRIYNLQFRRQSPASSSLDRGCVTVTGVGAGDIRCERSIFASIASDISGDVTAFETDDSSPDYIFNNNLVYGFNGTADFGIGGSGSTASAVIYNNTFIDCNLAINSRTGFLCKNNIFQDNTTDITSGVLENANNNYNLTDKGTITGANSVVNSTLTFVNKASDNFALVVGDTDAIGAGIGPSSDANVPTEGIIGTARSGATTDIGAFVFVGGGGGVTVTVTETLNSFADSSVIDIDFNVSLSVTEVLSPFADTSTLSITSGNVVLANITETLSPFSDSSAINLSANVSATVTEVLNSFLDGSNVTIAKDITVEVTEVLASFVDSSALRFPTNWVDKPAVITSYTTQTPVTTIWTDKG